MRSKLFLLLFLLCSCSPSTHWFLLEDNDYFKPTKNSDQQYTQGLRIGVTTSSQDFKSKTYKTFYGQQLFYTPGNKQETSIQTSDRPYAGYLAGGYKESTRILREQTTRGIELGLVGEHAYGEEVQRWVHRGLGQRYPKGWDNQLRDEPTILLNYEHQRLHERGVTVYGLHAGNLFTQAYTGAFFQYGTNNDFINDVTFPRIKRNSLQQDLDRTSEFTWNTFAGPVARAVFRNIFLDGNTFEDSHSVNSYPIVLEGRIGFHIKYKRFRFGYTYIKQTKEYTTEKKGADFGEVSLDWGF